MAGTIATNERARANHGGDLGPAQLDDVVLRLTEIWQAAKMRCALEVGEFVVREIFQGDLAAVRARGRKHASFRRLAAHPHLPCSASTLWRQVAIFELAQRFPGIVRNNKQFGVAHARAVLGLAAATQESLIRSCLQQRWTSRELEAQANVYRANEAAKTRSPRRFMATLKRVDRFTTEVLRVDRLPVTRAELGNPAVVLKTIQQMRAWCDAVERRCDTALN
jgi:hypothetical protein